MNLYHVSEDPNIEIFYPRTPKREDLDKNIALVWAIEEAKLSNFLTPRNCPRVGYHINDDVSLETRKEFFSSSTSLSCLVIENDCLETLKNTTLYLYEFDPSDFYLQDKVAGYYVSQKMQKPIKKIKISNIITDLQSRDVELKTVISLEEVSSKVQVSNLDWSLCRMEFAKHNK